MHLDKILVSMLAENTGAHMLDSGGAHGRNYQRNKGKSLADWRKMPEATVCAELSTHSKTGGYFVAEISVFHFLSKCLDSYDAKLTRQLWRFDARKANEREGWMQNVDAWLEEIGAEDGELGGGWINTYNGDDSVSQTLQYRPFSLDGAEFVALQIHGGCDVRGGYTRPRVFALPRCPDVSLWDNNRFTVADSVNAWYYDGGNHFETSDHNPVKLDLNAARFTGDEAKRGKGEIYVDADGKAYSPLSGEELKGYIQ